MSSEKPFLIRFFTMSGEVHSFDEASPETARQNLGHLRPETLFGDEPIMIGGSHSASAFRTKTLLRVEVTARPRPQWSFGARVNTARLLTTEEFGRRLAERAEIERTEQLLKENETSTGLISLEDVRGERFYVEVEGRPGPSNVARHMLSRLLSAPVIHVQHGETDIFFNSQLIEAVSLHPGPPSLPSTAFEAHRIQS